jgi:hypothetical protein
MVSWQFAEFALYHAECADEVMEARLDRDSIVCWCPCCGALWVFGQAGEAGSQGLVGSRAYRRCEGTNGPLGEGK